MQVAYLFELEVPVSWDSGGGGGIYSYLDKSKYEIGKQTHFKGPNDENCPPY